MRSRIVAARPWPAFVVSTCVENENPITAAQLRPMRSLLAPTALEVHPRHLHFNSRFLRNILAI